VLPQSIVVGHPYPAPAKEVMSALDRVSFLEFADFQEANPGSTAIWRYIKDADLFNILGLPRNLWV
jgi:hypothetical protein